MRDSVSNLFNDSFVYTYDNQNNSTLPEISRERFALSIKQSASYFKFQFKTVSRLRRIHDWIFEMLKLALIIAKDRGSSRGIGQFDLQPIDKFFARYAIGEKATQQRIRLTFRGTHSAATETLADEVASGKFDPAESSRDPRRPRGATIARSADLRRKHAIRERSFVTACRLVFATDAQLLTGEPDLYSRERELLTL